MQIKNLNDKALWFKNSNKQVKSINDTTVTHNGTIKHHLAFLIFNKQTKSSISCTFRNCMIREEKNVNTTNTICNA